MYNDYIRNKYQNKLTESQFDMLNFILDTYPETILMVNGEYNEPMFDLLAFLAKYVGYYKDLIDGMGLSLQELLTKIKVSKEVEYSNDNSAIENYKRLVVKKVVESDFENLLSDSMTMEEMFNFINNNLPLFINQNYRKLNLGSRASIHRFILDYISSKEKPVPQIEINVLPIGHVDNKTEGIVVELLNPDRNGDSDYYSDAFNSYIEMSSVPYDAPRLGYFLAVDSEIVKLLNRHYAPAGVKIYVVANYNITEFNVVGNLSIPEMGINRVGLENIINIIHPPKVSMEKDPERNAAKITIINDNAEDKYVNISVTWSKPGEQDITRTIFNKLLPKQSSTIIDYGSNPHEVTNYNLWQSEAIVKAKVQFVDEDWSLVTTSSVTIPQNKAAAPTIVETSVSYRNNNPNGIAEATFKINYNKSAIIESRVEEYIAPYSGSPTEKNIGTFTYLPLLKQKGNFYFIGNTHYAKVISKVIANYTDDSDEVFEFVGYEWINIPEEEASGKPLAYVNNNGISDLIRPHKSGLYAKVASTFKWVSKGQTADESIAACRSCPPDNSINPPTYLGQKCRCLVTPGLHELYETEVNTYSYYLSISRNKTT